MKDLAGIERCREIEFGRRDFHPAINSHPEGSRGIPRRTGMLALDSVSSW
jgi:hypothetical protein